MADVEIYTRKMCGYCTAAKSLLSRKGASFREFDATFDAGLRQEMMRKSGRTTFPQIFIGDAHISGWRKLEPMIESGEIDRLLG